MLGWLNKLKVLCSKLNVNCTGELNYFLDNVYNVSGLENFVADFLIWSMSSSSVLIKIQKNKQLSTNTWMKWHYNWNNHAIIII